MNKKNENKLKGDSMLLIAALIWGFAFVAQSAGMEHVGPITFQAIRFILGSVALIPVIIILDKGKKRAGTYKKMTMQERKILYIGSLFCGISLCAAALAQQYGILYTDIGKAGFITAMYILLVPVLGLFLKKKVPIRIWGCIGVAIVGLYFLSIQEGFSISLGDGLTILAAFLFAIQILFVDYYVLKVDGVRLAFLQFFVTGMISLVLMFIFEQPTINSILAVWPMILYAGVGSCSVAYTFQIIGQKYTAPAIAALIMSLESVFATIGGVIFLQQIPSRREWFGIALMFFAIVVSQLPEKNKDLITKSVRE